MHAVLTAFARAAAALPDDPAAAEAALADARAAWSSLATDEQAALAPLGRLLRERVGALATARGANAATTGQLALAAVMPAELPSGAMAGADPIGASSGGAAPRSAAAPVSDPQPAAPPRSPADPDEAAFLAHYANLAEDAAAEDHIPAVDLGEALEAAPSARAVGIATDATPESLLARFGLPAFRPGQREAVQAALDGRDALVVMPTGGGKSLCYQLPAIASDALTIVVSPLIALIADQHGRLLEAGVRSVMLASTLGEEVIARGLDDVRSGTAQVVFCAPERFASRALRRALAARTIGLFVVDEAHCVSEWGHDFRPDYLRLRPVIEELGRPPVMAATATATPKVASEIAERLGLRDPLVVRRGFDRPNLSFDVVPLAGDGAVARKRGALLNGLRDPANRPAVVYCGTRKDTEAVRDLLSAEGLDAAAYHAGMSAERRRREQERFMTGDCDVVVATNAFGMGVDKADIRSVWHWALPTSVEAYYQEAGRAGRDGEPARAVLLAMRGDLGRLVQFIKDAELTPGDVRGLTRRLADRAMGDVAEVEPRALDDRARVALGVAERVGAVSVAPAGGGRLAVRLLDPLDERAAARVCREATGRRWDAYQALKRFADTSDVCRRRQLLDHFGDDEPTSPLGRCCDVCDPIDWLDIPTHGHRARRPAAPATDGPPVDEAQLETLKAWRLSRAEGKPAYTVATNAALEEVLRRRPSSPGELLAIRGIGPAFVERHGESLLEEVAAL